MRCARVKGLLSDYVDGLLDPERAALVQKHLAQCGKCQKELESLQALIHELRSLEPVKAPDGFLTGLHERLERDSWLTRLKAFLTIPVRIRIPMELATLATTVIIAFFIFHLIPFSARDVHEEKAAAKRPAAVVAPDGSSAPAQATNDDSRGIEAPVLSFKPMEKAAPQNRLDEVKRDINEKEDIQAQKGKLEFALPADREKRVSGTQTAPAQPATSASQAPPVRAEKKDRSRVSPDIQTEDLKSAEPQTKVAEKQEKTGEERAQTTDHFYDRIGAETQPIPLVLHIGSDYDKKIASAPSSQVIQSNLELPKKEQPRPATAGTQVQTESAKELSKSKAVPAGAEALGVASLRTEAEGGSLQEEISLKIQKMLVPLNGKITQMDLNKDTQLPEFLLIEIPVQNYPRFTAKLNEMGTLNIPAEQAVGPYPQIVRVKLQLMIQK